MKVKLLKIDKILIFFLLIFIIARLLYGYIIPVISLEMMNNGMLPTIEKRDIVIIRKIKDQQNFKFKRGMIVVFKLANNRKYYCGRIVSLNGEKFEISKEGYILINGKKLEEPKIFTHLKYLPDGNYQQLEKIPEGYIFVLGDNTNESLDSRYIGPVPLKNIVGIVIGIKKKHKYE